MFSLGLWSGNMAGNSFIYVIKLHKYPIISWLGVIFHYQSAHSHKQQSLTDPTISKLILTERKPTFTSSLSSSQIVFANLKSVFKITFPPTRVSCIGVDDISSCFGIQYDYSFFSHRRLVFPFVYRIATFETKGRD